MRKGKNSLGISKKDLEKADPNLVPTRNVKTNLSRGEDDIIPDPDDIPGGLNPNLTHRLDINQADFLAGLESTEKKPSGKKKKKK